MIYLGKEIPTNLEPCVAVLESIHLEHHWPGYHTKDGLSVASWGLWIRSRTNWSSFDSDELTRLVIACTIHSVRADLRGSSQGHIELMLHPRDPSKKSVMKGHYSPDDLHTKIDRMRETA